MEQLNQKVAMALLAKMGHSVVLAEDGQQAVDKWRGTLTAQTLKLLPAQKMTHSGNILLHTARTPIPTQPLELSDAKLGIAPPRPPSAVLNVSPLVFDICLMDLSMPVHTIILALSFSLRGHGFNCYSSRSHFRTLI